MKSLRRFFAVLPLVAGGALAWAVPEQAAKLAFFESRIRPALVEHCYKCHSAESDKSKGGLRLDSRAGWQVGGDSGAVVVPGRPEESLLVKAIGHSGEIPEMPPKSRLPAALVEDFRRWIAEGAVDPRVGEAPAREAEAIDIEAGRQFWSFRPRRAFAAEKSIDDFVSPQAPDAPADKLVRRLFLDLVGLPPTSGERGRFRRLYEEQSPGKAVEVFADELLARRGFGEKWARHWLDVARYADSNGGDFNLTFHEAWRYRNYVIDAFNDDLPYDQFLREQIAGDLLPHSSPGQRNRRLVATGFLMLGAKMLTERDKPKMHLDVADEQLDTLGRATMGLTLGCARCHDHKFDPLPTADYYAMAGILHSTRTADRVLMNNVNVTGWTNTDLLPDAETQALAAAHEAKVEQLRRQIARAKEEAREQEPAAERESVAIVVDDVDAETTGPWRKSTFRPNRIGAHYLATDKDKAPCSIHWKATLPRPGEYELRVSFGGGSGLARKAPYLVRHAKGETRLTINQTRKPTIRGLWFPLGRFTFDAPAERPVTAEVLLSDKDAGGHVIADAIQLVHVDDLEKEATENTGPPTAPGAIVSKLEEELDKLKKDAPQPGQAMAARDLANQRLGNLRIRIRGETKNLGPEAPRGFLQVAHYPGAPPADIPEGQSGRVQLAEWLTHENHPLTARVMANRIWQQLFGAGIVATSDNFGTLGSAPTHPELLDHLANHLVAHGWSMKALIREILLSKTYRQAAATPAEDDPDNARLRHQNRRPAPAETLRDSILAIAGELDREPRQSAVRQLGTYAIATSGSRHASLARTGELRQRSIYMPIVRGAPPPSLAVFDLPNPDLLTGARATTTVPAQALFMMNAPFVRQMAEATAKRFTEPGSPPEETIARLYRDILVREADPDDLATAKAYLAQLTGQEGKTRRQALASLVQVLFCSTEFRFIE